MGIVVLKIELLIKEFFPNLSHQTHEMPSNDHLYTDEIKKIWLEEQPQREEQARKRKADEMEKIAKMDARRVESARIRFEEMEMRAERLKKLQAEVNATRVADQPRQKLTAGDAWEAEIARSKLFHVSEKAKRDAVEKLRIVNAIETRRIYQARFGANGEIHPMC